MTNANVEGLELVVGEFENISGRVIWDGAPKLEQPPLMVHAESMEDSQVPAMEWLTVTASLF